MNSKKVIRRGDIWMVELKESYGYMLKGLHPCIILSNYRCLQNSPLIQIVPISSKPKCQPFHVELEGCGLNTKSIALVEQLTTIGKDVLKFQIGKVSYEKMTEIENAISQQIGMNNNYSIEMFESVKSMLDELQELDRYLIEEFSEEINEERNILLRDLQRYCINHSIKIDLQKFVKKEGEVYARAI